MPHGSIAGVKDSPACVSTPMVQLRPRKLCTLVPMGEAVTSSSLDVGTLRLEGWGPKQPSVPFPYSGKKKRHPSVCNVPNDKCASPTCKYGRPPSKQKPDYFTYFFLPGGVAQRDNRMNIFLRENRYWGGPLILFIYVLVIFFQRVCQDIQLPMSRKAALEDQRVTG